MALESIFGIVNGLTLFGWIILFVFYPKKWVYILLFSLLLLLLSISYLYFIVVGIGGGAEGGFGSLAEVATLFQNQEALLAGWIHYLAFDLFVGMWITSDAWEKGINRWLVLPCLVFTFMLGPVGLLLYMAVRGIKTKKLIQTPFEP